MNKKILYALLAVIMLTACAGNTDKDKPTDTDNTSAVTADASTTSQNDPEEGSTTDKESEVAATVTFPPIPETGLPEIPGEHIVYSDTEVLIVVDPEGTSYANGKPVSPDDAQNIIIQQMDSLVTKSSTSDTSSSSPLPEIPDVTENHPETTITVPDVSYPEETERPEGTIIIDDTEDNGIFNLAKYVKTGSTDLSITDIKVFSASKPGVNGVDAFKQGETVIVNLWCNSEARFDSILYIVPEEAEHKESYAPEDCLYSYELFTAHESEEGQIAFEVTLPSQVAAGVYEFRFVCGTEEGYIPFHIG